MNITERLIQLRFNLDKRSNKERQLILLATLSCLLFLWYFLLYRPQTRALQQIQTALQQETAATQQLNEKQFTIKALVNAPETDHLLKQYQQLQAQMKTLQKQFYRYQTRFIDDKQLNDLLQAILPQTPHVTILSFNNMSVPAPKPLTTSNQKPPPQPIEPKAQQTRYELVLKGNYFSILAYLKKLEETHWQLYWDTFRYEVNAYPEATVTIEFYTLKPPESSGDAL